jgi:hypothetical protein
MAQTNLNLIMAFENIIIYFSLVFRPCVLVRMSREHLDATQQIKKMREDIGQMNKIIKEFLEDKIEDED